MFWNNDSDNEMRERTSFCFKVDHDEGGTIDSEDEYQENSRTCCRLQYLTEGSLKIKSCM